MSKVIAKWLCNWSGHEGFIQGKIYTQYTYDSYGYVLIGHEGVKPYVYPKGMFKGDTVNGTRVSFTRVKDKPSPWHPHHEVILAWLDGEVVQQLDTRGCWHTAGVHADSSFPVKSQYRIKPKLSEGELQIIEIENTISKLTQQVKELKGE